METFLAEVARTLREKHPNDLDKVTVVFNNRRSGLFLRRQFAAMDGGPFFLPNIIGIDELVSDLGNLEIVPNEFLLFELYNIHCLIGGENRKFQTFEEFLSFGDMMLVDFSEIDLYCVDAQQLFSNLHDIKAIGEWDITTGELTEFQKRYLEFYQSLYQYYKLIHERLLSQGKAFSGMAYRHVAENIESLYENKPVHKIYFVGFNALSSSEKTIIQHYEKLGIGQLITDGDAYYYNDADQEAGHFLRIHAATQSTEDKVYTDHFALGRKDITIVSCPENVLQCKYAGELLAQQVQHTPENPIEQTAIVLADESLLMPTLNALPPEIKTANITMGYPFRSTAVHSLMIKLFSLQQRRRHNLFYHQDITDILTDLGICKILGINNIHYKLTHILTKEHFIYASKDEIDSFCKKMGCESTQLDFIFSEAEPTPDEFLKMAEQLTQILYTSKVYASDLKEKEALACLLEIIHHFQNLQNEYHFVENLNVLLKIYTRMAQRRSVSFYGEPLQGLQILGVLETRNLDFKRVILISANEGTIPSGKTNNTLIPYNLKVAFGIPTFHDKDAVYAYNFYRLLQRADNIHLLYSTESDGMGKGSPSRFILQVRRELAERYPDNITIHEKVLSAPNFSTPKSDIDQFGKDPLSIHRIKEIAEKGFSPSALNKYRSCPLKFYYENILGIQENDAVSEDMERNELGSYIHAVLENTYGQCKDGYVTVEILQNALDNIDNLLSEVLSQQFNHGRSHIGRNHYLESVAKIQISKFLAKEIAQIKKGAQIRILGLEERLSHTITINIEGNDYPVTIAGFADRIDQFNEFTRIIDYKSGKVEDKDLVVNDEQPDWSQVPDKWFQVMLYTWLYKHTHDTSSPHLAGIYPLGHTNSEFKHATWGSDEFMTPQHLAEFEQMLKEILSAIINPKIPFLPNQDSKNKLCQYCSFCETCYRATNTPQ